ncbi:MAG: hypothetical protein RL180_291, partial [Pseudomonadota bacterium]
MKSTRSLFPLILGGMALGAHAAPVEATDTAPTTIMATDAVDSTTPQDALPAVHIKGKRDRAETSAKVSSAALHTPTALKDTPQTVNVVTEAIMKSQNATTLKDALRNVAGLTFSAGEGGAIGDSINMRGFTARNDVFVDGMRDRAQISRDTAFLQKVEVLKGSAAMAFGRGGVGGVINQSVKHAQKASVRELSVAAGTEQYGRVT